MTFCHPELKQVDQKGEIPTNRAEGEEEGGDGDDEGGEEGGETDEEEAEIGAEEEEMNGGMRSIDEEEGLIRERLASMSENGEGK